MTKRSGAWDRLKWEVQTICAWRRKTQEQRSQKPSDCWLSRCTLKDKPDLDGEETEGRGTPGSGRVYPGDCTGRDPWRVGAGGREDPPGEVWWGHNGKKKETNSSHVLCCDETSIAVLEVIMPQFTESVQLWRKCIPGDLSYQCLHESGWSWKCWWWSFHYRSSKMDIVEVTWAKEGAESSEGNEFTCWASGHSFPPVKRFHLKGLALP